MLQASFEGPAQRHRRTLAQLDALIARAEGDVERRAAAAGRLTGAGRNPGPARTRLRMAERRLALLRQSREYQLQGDPLPLIDAPH